MLLDRVQDIGCYIDGKQDIGCYIDRVRDFINIKNTKYMNYTIRIQNTVYRVFYRQSTVYIC